MLSRKSYEFSTISYTMFILYTMRMYNVYCTNPIHCTIVPTQYIVQLYQSNTLYNCTNPIHCTIVPNQYIVQCTNPIHCTIVPIQYIVQLYKSNTLYNIVPIQYILPLYQSNILYLFRELRNKMN